MANGVIIPQDIKGDWSVLVNTSTCVIAYKIDKYTVSVYLDYKATAGDWTAAGTLPSEARPFYTHYIPAYVDYTINGYKMYHIDKDSGVISVKGNTGSTPTVHVYPKE